MALAAGTGQALATPESIRAYVVGDPVRTEYDGITNDLLTGGLGASGLESFVPARPSFAPADPSAPTVEELRTLAILSNYRALVDTTANGGFGTLYGPTVGVPDAVKALDGKIAGTEYLAVLDGGRGSERATVMVQIPSSFSTTEPCIVTATSSGSRGVYGAIGTAGEWGLKKGCAVAYTDKGTGTGAFDLSAGAGYAIRGQRVDASEDGDALNFAPKVPRTELARYVAANANRWAFKHAHSQDNPERHWGDDTLRAVLFAFHVLNEHFAGDPEAGAITPEGTVVIASSVSNGGGAALRAAEDDRWGLIDGVAVSEPNVNPKRDRRFVIRQGDGPALVEHGRPLYDYVTQYTLLQGCASAPLAIPLSQQACEDLKAAGVAASTPETARKALADYGLVAAQDAIAPFYWSTNVYQSVAVTYANAYSRSRVTEDLCGYSLAAADAAGAIQLPAASAGILFATSNGVPPTGGIQLLRDGKPRSLGGPVSDVPGALCLRSLWLGVDPVTGAPLPPALKGKADQVAAGVKQVLADADLGGRPAVIVHGRADALIPVNHTSRSYYGSALRQKQEIRYYEVTNAHHLDAFNPFFFQRTQVPLHVYFNRALDLVYDRLTKGKPLPPSQVVRTKPGVTPIGGRVPPIVADPGKDAITFDGKTLGIPD